MDTTQFVPLLTNVLMLVLLWSMNLGQGMSFTLQQVATRRSRSPSSSCWPYC